MSNVRKTTRPKILQGFGSTASVFDSEEAVNAFAGFRKRRAKSDLNAPTTMFGDATAAKSAALQKVCSVDPWLSLYSYDGFRGALIHSQVWMYASILLVLSNTLWIAIETDMPEIDRPAHWLVSVDSIFCLLFLLELLARVSALTRWRYFLTDAWLMFDAVLAVMNVLEAWIIPHLGTDAYSEGATGSLRVLRVLRLSRIARTLAIFRLIPELAVLIRSITQALRAVTAVMSLLLLFVYVNALYFTNLARDTELEATLFPDVMTSMKTLLFRGTLLDGPLHVIDMLVRESAVLTMLFAMFMFITACLLLNMLVGVLVEVVSVSATVEQEETVAHFVMDALTQCLTNIGHDNEQKVTRKQMERVVRQGVMNEVMRCLDISMSKSTLLDHIFETDGEAVETVHLSTVVMTLLQLRSTAPATVRDVLDARRCVLHKVSELENLLREPARLRRPARKHHGPAIPASKFSSTSLLSPTASLSSAIHHSTATSGLVIPAAESAATRDLLSSKEVLSSKALISQEFEELTQQLTELQERVLSDLLALQMGSHGGVAGIPHFHSTGDAVQSDAGKSPRPAWQSPQGRSRRGEHVGFDAFAPTTSDMPYATRLRSEESSIAATRLRSGDSAMSGTVDGDVRQAATRLRSGESAISGLVNGDARQHAATRLRPSWESATNDAVVGAVQVLADQRLEDATGQGVSALSSKPNHAVDVIVHYSF